MGDLNPVTKCVFDAGLVELDYAYDAPQYDYKHRRVVRLPKERDFQVTGMANQRLQPVPQKMFTTTSGEANRVFYQPFCDYDSLSRVFVWPNRDPLGDFGSVVDMTSILLIDKNYPILGNIKIDSNLYLYNNNDSVNKVDPDGRCPWCLGALAGGLGNLALQLALGHGSLSDRLHNLNVCDIGVGAAEGALGFGALKNFSQAYKAYKLAKDTDAVAEGVKDSVLIAKGTAESVANSIRKDVAKGVSKAAVGIIGGKAADQAINAADENFHGNGNGDSKKWCTPFK